MNNQHSLFGQPQEAADQATKSLGAQLRDEGMALAESAVPVTDMDKLRWYARRHVARHGSVTIDDVREWADTKRITLRPAAWGNVLRKPFFNPTGYVQSTRPTNHARPVRVWSI